MRGRASPPTRAMMPLLCGSWDWSAADSIVIGRQLFTESYILEGDGAAGHRGVVAVPVTRKIGMGSTGIFIEGLRKRAIDVVPGIIRGRLAEAILKRAGIAIAR